MQGRITKVLNMKPIEILGLIEEAAGTRMFEMKKQQAIKTIEKKESKLDEIKRVINEDITPRLEKLEVLSIDGNALRGVPPSSTLMVAFGTLAFAANLVCFRLLTRFRHQDVNMASTWECSRNDLINNCGVLLAAGLVWWFASPWPDIAIGGVIALIFLRSAVRVIADAAPQLRAT